MAVKDKKATKAPNSGILSPVVGTELPRDFVTWHDLNPHRIWVHSRAFKAGYKPISVEIEWIGSESTNISEDEINFRIKLAATRKSDVDSAELSPSTFRAVPFGAILEMHSALVTNQKIGKLSSKESKPINLVKEYEKETYETFILMANGDFKKKDLGFKNEELRASNSDSLLIAHVYAEQTSIGSKKPAQMTAKLLGIDISLVYAAVKVARKKGWLTSNGVGASGGVMTEEGKKLYAQSDSGEKYAKYFIRFFQSMREDIKKFTEETEK